MRGAWMGWTALGGLLAGCPTPPGEPPEPEAAPEERAEPVGEAEGPQLMAGVEALVAVLSPVEGHEARGVVRFERARRDAVRVSGRLEGLSVGGEHGFHVHEYGDCSAPEETAGDHYNPTGDEHALPPEMPRHAGDMGNVYADENGVATLDETFGTMSLVETPAPILGRAVIVHGRRDEGSQPDGDAGPPIACGVIGIASGGGSGER